MLIYYIANYILFELCEQYNKKRGKKISKMFVYDKIINGFKQDKFSNLSNI